MPDGFLKSSEELWLAKLLRLHSIPYYYEAVEFPHFCPDFVFHQPLVWTGRPCKGRLIWGIEMKFTIHHPKWPVWKAKSESLDAEHNIKILVLSREHIEGYYHRGFLPLALPN